MNKNSMKIMKICGWVLAICAVLQLFMGQFLSAICCAAGAWFGLSHLKKAKQKEIDTSHPVNRSNTLTQSKQNYQGSTIQQNNSVRQSSTVVHHSVQQNASVPVDQKLADILSNVFPRYTVKRNVDFASLTSEWWICDCGAENMGSFCCECGRSKPVNTEWTCKCGCSNTSKFCSDCGIPKPAPLQYEPIDFLLLENGMPKLAILIVTRRKWNHKSVRNTLDACDNAGIRWQRYFEGFENDTAYITDRIGKNLR